MTAQEAELLAQSVTLPCGIKVPNRLVKAPLQEFLGYAGGGDPSPELFKLYQEWAAGGWGMVITGNVMVSHKQLGSPFDVVVPFPSSPNFDKSMKAFRTWSEHCHGVSQINNKESSNIRPLTPVVIIQLCDPGRQSSRGSGRHVLEPALAPSAVQLSAGPGVLGSVVSKVMFGTPKEMTETDIDDVVRGFVQGAVVASETGFQGVELHCSHGYLLAQFLSPNVNLRTDSYGGSARNRMKIILRIVSEIREKLPTSSGFCVGIKLNSSDYVQGGMTETEALDNVKWIAEHGGVDFIDISGGTYESPVMLQGEAHEAAPPTAPTLKSTTPTEKTKLREAFFLSFADSAQKLLSNMAESSLPTTVPKIMVTGGFRTRSGMAAAVSSGSTSMIGLGRPACADPHLPLKLLDPKATDPAVTRAPVYTIRGTKVMRYLPLALILPGVQTLWHAMLLAQVSEGKQPDLRMSLMGGVWKVWIRKLLGKRFWLAVIFLLAVLMGMGQRLGR